MRAAKGHHSTAAERARLQRERRDVWLAFGWHCLELALVAALMFYAPNPFLAVLLGLSIIGWAWSLGHLPGKVA